METFRFSRQISGRAIHFSSCQAEKKWEGGRTTIKKTRKFKKIFFSFAFSSALLCVCAFPPLLLSTSAKFEGKVLVLKSVHHNNEDIDVWKLPMKLVFYLIFFFSFARFFFFSLPSSIITSNYEDYLSSAFLIQLRSRFFNWRLQRGSYSEYFSGRIYEMSSQGWRYSPCFNRLWSR